LPEALVARYFRRVLRTAWNVSAVAGLVLFAILFTPLVHWWGQALSVPWGAGRGDVLVVLAGSALGDGILGESSYWRSVFATQDYRATPYRRVIVSGTSEGALPVAAGMKKFLQAHDIPATAIEVEAQSHSTRENAEFTARLLAGETGRVVLVTSDYHMFRATRLFARAGVTVIPHPYPDIEKRYHRMERRWGAAADLAVEAVKIVYYRWQGWI
jgi:uncharacterized SAM-binding protein YcdF (DUF218 family)